MTDVRIGNKTAARQRYGRTIDRTRDPKGDKSMKETETCSTARAALAQQNNQGDWPYARGYKLLGQSYPIA